MNAFGEATQDEVKGVPEFNAIRRCDGTNEGVFALGLHDMACEESLALIGQLTNDGGGLFDAFVLNELLHQGPAWVLSFGANGL